MAEELSNLLSDSRCSTFHLLFPQRRSSLRTLLRVRDQEEFLGLAAQPGARCHTARSLYFVPGEHPHANAGLTQLLQSLFALILQLVFDAGHSHKLHAHFEQLS